MPKDKKGGFKAKRPSTGKKFKKVPKIGESPKLKTPSTGKRPKKKKK